MKLRVKLVLNKFRKSLEPILEKIGVLFSSTGLSPNTLSLIGFLITIISSIIFGVNTLQLDPTINFSAIGSLVLLVGGFFDVIDGSVAKVTKKISRKGSFLDSTLDKISETIIFLGIAIGELANPILCLLAVSSSLLVSYTRSRAETLGIDLSGVGFGERAERILILAIMGLLPFPYSLEYGVIIIIVISIITIIQRIYKALKNL
ncbi:MAG TPA: CDP-alcohol phosphatidyltransferase family protein [Nitrososphaeraceae archaeon]|nr:CDP-alcohol phosphatidyltransferase family protein [Nitrososphaeraceae archaeon]